MHSPLPSPIDITDDRPIIAPFARRLWLDQSPNNWCVLDADANGWGVASDARGAMIEAMFEANRKGIKFVRVGTWTFEVSACLAAYEAGGREWDRTVACIDSCAAEPPERPVHPIRAAELRAWHTHARGEMGQKIARAYIKAAFWPFDRDSGDPVARPSHYTILPAPKGGRLWFWLALAGWAAAGALWAWTR